MKTEVKEVGKNLVEVSVEIEENVATKEYEKACKRIAQSVNIAGFRKGKAPKQIIEKYVGVESIQREALDSLLPGVFSDVINEHNYELISEPTLVSYELKAGEPCKVVSRFELRPEVKISEYKNMTVKVEEYKNEENALENELKKLAERYADFVKVEETRKTKADDAVMMDFEGSAKGELIKGGAAKNYMLDLGNSNFIPGFAEQLVDREVGKEFTITVKFPENYHDESLKGEDAEFKITINEIKEKKVPELNDDLAKKMGHFNTLDELKADIQKYLDGREKAENEKRAYEAMFEQILANTEVDIHDEMIQRESAAIMSDLELRAKQSGKNLQETIKAEGVENVEEETKKEALSRIKNSLVLSKIAQEEKIGVTAADMEVKMAEIAGMYGVSQDIMLKEMYKNVNLVQSITQQIISEKVSKFILDNNKVEYTK